MTCFYYSTVVVVVILIEKGRHSSSLEVARIKDRTFSFTLSEWCCIFIFLALAHSITAPLAVNILTYLCFWKRKAGLFTKFVDTFVFLFVGKRAS